MASSNDPQFELDRPVVFGEPTSYRVVKGLPKEIWDRSLQGVEPAGELSRIKEKWIYAFGLDLGLSAYLFAEYQANKDGNYLQNKSPDRDRLEPKEATDFGKPSPVVKLDTKVAGKTQLYFFVVSRVRLSRRALRYLVGFQGVPPEADKDRFKAARDGIEFPVWDLSAKNVFVSGRGGAMLPLVDIVSVGLDLQRQFARSLDAYGAYVNPAYYKPGSEEALVVEDRLLRYALASKIRELIRRDPSLEGSIGKRSELKDDSHGVELKVQELRKDTERCANFICALSRSKLMPLVASWFKDQGVAVEGDLVGILAEIHHRLEETSTGVHFLKEPSPVVLDILQGMAFPAIKPAFDAKKKFGVAKKASAPVAAFFAKFLPWYIEARAEVSGRKLLGLVLHEAVDHINEAFGHKVFVVAAFEGKNTVLEVETRLHDENPILFRRLKEDIEEVELLGNQRILLNQKEAVAALKANKPYKYLNNLAWFQRAVDLANNGWKVWALIDADKRTLYSYADAAGGIAGLLKNWFLDPWEKRWDLQKAKLGAAARAEAEEAAKGLRQAVRAEEDLRLVGSEEALLAASAQKAAAGQVAVRTAEELKLIEDLVAPKMLTAGLRVCVGVGIVADLASTYKDVSSALAEDDRNAALAFGASGAAAVLGGCVVLASGGTGLIFLLLAVQGSSSILALLTRDTSISGFIAHSIYGCHAGRSDKSPSWAAGKFSEWTTSREGILLQLRSLLGLTSQFSVSARGQAKVRVTMGCCYPGSTLVIVYADDRRKAPTFVEVNLDQGSSFTKPVEAGFPKVTLSRKGPQGAESVEHVEVEYRTAREAIEVRAAFCRVYLVTKVGAGSSGAESIHLPAKFVGIEGEVTDAEKDCLTNIMKGTSARPTPDETGLCYAIVRADSGNKNTYVNLREVAMMER